jgi:hypothetical protein
MTSPHIVWSFEGEGKNAHNISVGKFQKVTDWKERL